MLEALSKLKTSLENICFSSDLFTQDDLKMEIKYSPRKMWVWQCRSSWTEPFVQEIIYDNDFSVISYKSGTDTSLVKADQIILQGMYDSGNMVKLLRYDPRFVLEFCDRDILAAQGIYQATVWDEDAKDKYVTDGYLGIIDAFTICQFYMDKTILMHMLIGEHDVKEKTLDTTLSLGFRF